MCKSRNASRSRIGGDPSNSASIQPAERHRLIGGPGTAPNPPLTSNPGARFSASAWVESPRFEVEPFGVHTTIVEPGFFRTERLTAESTAHAELSSSLAVDEPAEDFSKFRQNRHVCSGI